MSDITLEQVFELAKQLPSEERAELVERLQGTLSSPLNYDVTSEELVAELEQLRASGAFKNVESLRGKYANSAIDVSAEEIQTYLYEIGTEWEQELDEFFGDD